MPENQQGTKKLAVAHGQPSSTAPPWLSYITTNQHVRRFPRPHEGLALVMHF